MATFVFRNRSTGVEMGRVTVKRPEDAFDALVRETGAAPDEIAMSLGKSVEDAREALDVEEVEEEKPGSGRKPKARRGDDPYKGLPRPRLFA